MNNNTKTKLCLFLSYWISVTGFLYPIYKLLMLIPWFKKYILDTEFSRSHAKKIDYIFLQWLLLTIASITLFLFTISFHNEIFNLFYISLLGLIIITPLTNCITNTFNLLTHNNAE